MKLSAIVITEGVTYQVYIEGDVNATSFNIIFVNKSLFLLEETWTQSINVLTFKQVCSNEITHVVLSYDEQIFQERKSVATK